MLSAMGCRADVNRAGRVMVFCLAAAAACSPGSDAPARSATPSTRHATGHPDAAGTIAIPGRAPGVGTRWSEERTFVNDADYTNDDGSHRLRTHTRHERLHQTVLAMEGDRISSVRLAIEDKSKTTRYGEAGTSSTTADPASGRTYLVVRDGDDVITSLTRADGSAVTSAEESSVADSAFGLMTRASFPELPARPLAVGEEFDYRREDSSGSYRITAVRGAEVDITVASRAEAGGQSQTSITVHTLSLATGWLLRSQGTSDFVTTGATLPAGCIKAVNRTSSRAAYTYE